MSETFISERLQRDIMIKAVWSLCKVPGILDPLCPNLNILDRFHHSTDHNISRKSVLWESGVGDQTGRHMAKLMVACRKFANKSNN